VVQAVHRAPITIAVVLMFSGCVGSSTSATSKISPTEFFLSALMTLDGSPGDETMAVRAAPFFQAWKAGEDYPTWVADPLHSDITITTLNVTLYLRADGPVVQSARFPDIMVYAGSGDAWMGYGERRDVDALVPGQTYRIEIPIADSGSPQRLR
jgi:hypothetical protein